MKNNLINNCIKDEIEKLDSKTDYNFSIISETKQGKITRLEFRITKTGWVYKMKKTKGQLIEWFIKLKRVEMLELYESQWKCGVYQRDCDKEYSEKQKAKANTKGAKR